MNKIKLWTVLGMGFLPSVVTPAASANDLYLGGGVISGSGETEFTSSYDSATADHDNTGSFFRFGFINNNNSRSEFSFSSITLDNQGAEDEITGVDFNYISSFGDGGIQPVLGFGFGYYTWENTAYLFEDNEDLTGVSLNYAAGILFSLGDQMELEASYRGKYIAWQDVSIYGEVIETSTSMSNIFLGINFKFD